MAFQPYNTAEGLLYPSGLEQIAPGVYSTGDLPETAAGSMLYGYRLGDYAYPAYTPVPHVELTLFDLTDDTVTVTLYRTVKTRTLPVPGQINVYAVGGRNVVDWDAPFNIPITYRAEQFDAVGNSLGFTRPFTTVLPYDGDFVHNVFDPANGVPVTMAGQAAAALKRPIPTDTYWASGSGVGVGISGQRRGLTDVDVSFLTFDLTTADKVQGMFGDPYVSPTVPPVLCIRTGRNMRLPQPFYALVTDPTEVPLDLGAGGELIRWECTATEVARPAPTLVAPVLTYEDIDDAYATYELMDAAYETYLERDRDYSLLGSDPTTNPGSGGGTGGGGSGTPPEQEPELYGQGVYGAGIFGA
jgi:hypothetical protein